MASPTTTLENSSNGIFVNIYNSPVKVFIAFSTILSIWYILFPDIIPLHNGFAWEGEYYRRVAIDFPKHLVDIKINSYSIQRVFPFMILYYFFKIFNIPFYDNYLILWMQIFNLLLGLVMICTWHRIAKVLSLSLAAEWFGYLMYFVSFSFAKYDLYIPFTTDRLSSAVGLLSIYFYLRRWAIALWFNAVVSLMIWPTALVYNLLLLFIPVDEPLPKTQNKQLSLLWAVFIALVFAGLFIGVLYIRSVPVPPRLTPDVKPLLPAGIFLTSLFLFITQHQLAKRVFPGWNEMWSIIVRLFKPRLAYLLIILLIGLYLLLTRVLGDTEHPYLPFKTFLINTTFAVLQRPLQFLVSHSVYYGMPVAIMCLFWQRILLVLNKLGLGLSLMLMIVLVQGINSETRQLANVMPLIIIVTALVVDTLSVRPVVILMIALIQFVISKAWLPFNWFDPTYGHPEDRFPSFSFVHNGFMLEWPFQVYFMNQGPWISNKYLIIQGFIILLAATLVYRLLKSSGSRIRHVNS